MQLAMPQLRCALRRSSRGFRASKPCRTLSRARSRRARSASRRRASSGTRCTRPRATTRCAPAGKSASLEKGAGTAQEGALSVLALTSSVPTRTRRLGDGQGHPRSPQQQSQTHTQPQHTHRSSAASSPLAAACSPQATNKPINPQTGRPARLAGQLWPTDQPTDRIRVFDQSKLEIHYSNLDLN